MRRGAGRRRKGTKRDQGTRVGDGISGCQGHTLEYGEGGSGKSEMPERECRGYSEQKAEQAMFRGYVRWIMRIRAGREDAGGRRGEHRGTP